MRSECCYEQVIKDGVISTHKFLIVYKDNDDLPSKFDLTLMGLEQIDSYEQLEQFIGKSHYKYNQGVLIDYLIKRKSRRIKKHKLTFK